MCKVLDLFSSLEAPRLLVSALWEHLSKEESDGAGLAISQPLLRYFTQQPPFLIQDPQADTTVQLKL